MPDARALLYEDVVDLLLWRWEAVKLEKENESRCRRVGLLTEEGVFLNTSEIVQHVTVIRQGDFIDPWLIAASLYAIHQ